jgi:hypothetical protein
MSIMVFCQLLTAIHMAAGHFGVWAWIQAPHFMGGCGIIRGHLVTAWEYQI